MDTIKPRATVTTPANLKTGVLPAANVFVTFSEPMRAAAIPANVDIKKSGTTTFMPATVTYSPATRKATLNSKANLQAGATYVVTVGAGTKDVAGNGLDQAPSVVGLQAKTFRFTVKR